MGYLIAYGYQTGDVVRQLQTITMVMQAPNQPPVTATTELESVTHVLSEEEGLLTVRVDVRTLSKAGLLKQAGVESDVAGSITFTMDRFGTIVKCDNPAVPKMECFPAAEVEVGMAWQNVDPDHPVQHMLEAVEGDRARLISQMTLQTPQQTTQMNGMQIFDLTRGLQLESTSVVKTTTPDGRVTDVVVECRLA